MFETVVFVALILVVLGVVSFGGAALFIGKIIMWSAIVGLGIMVASYIFARD